MNHLALAVTDQERSRRFYERYLDFGAAPARRYPDGTLMLYDPDGFALALGRVEPGAVRLPPFLHFGRGLSAAADVRALQAMAADDGVEVVEAWDEPGYVSVKLRDPDGYVVELFWEPAG